MIPSSGAPVFVVGVGDAWRGDEGAGLEVARRLRLHLPGARVLAASDDLTWLVDRWRPAEQVVLVDSVRSGSAPGTVHRADLTAPPDLRARTGPRDILLAASHHLALGEMIAMAGVLDRMPHGMVLYGIEVEATAPGTGLSAATARAVHEVVTELVALLGGRGSPYPRGDRVGERPA